MLLNKKQAAQRIGVSYTTLREWVALGKLPSPTFRSGKRDQIFYWDDSVIDCFLKSNSDKEYQTSPNNKNAC